MYSGDQHRSWHGTTIQALVLDKDTSTSHSGKIPASADTVTPLPLCATPSLVEAASLSHSLVEADSLSHSTSSLVEAPSLSHTRPTPLLVKVSSLSHTRPTPSLVKVPSLSCSLVEASSLSRNETMLSSGDHTITLIATEVDEYLVEIDKITLALLCTSDISNTEGSCPKSSQGSENDNASNNFWDIKEHIIGLAVGMATVVTVVITLVARIYCL